MGGAFYTFSLVQALLIFRFIVMIMDDVNYIYHSAYRRLASEATEIFLLYEAGFFGQR